MSGRGRLLPLCALLVALAACAGGPGPAPLPGDPMPSHHLWAPEGPPRALVLALHGFNDHGQGFALFGEAAAQAGVLVKAYDQPGFGSRGDRGLWPGIPAMLADARAEAAILRAAHPGVPLFLLGESMGAAVALLLAAEPGPRPFDGVILSAPAVWGGDQLNPLYRLALRLAGALFPDLAVQATGDRFRVQASDNIEALRALARDPLVIKRTRLGAVAGLVELMDEALAQAPSATGPLLVLAGARDELIPAPAFASLRARIAASSCRWVGYPEGWHLLLRDLQRETVYRDILAWIDGAALPSGQDEPCAGPVAVAGLSPAGARAPR